MGVKGLISYLEKCGFKPTTTASPSEPNQDGTCPKRLVIDGSSFIHHVCFAHSDWTFSGDYAVIKAYLRGYIRLLNGSVGWDGTYRDAQTCFPIQGKVPPRTSNDSWLLWVMDGPLPDSKIGTRCNRLQQKLETAKELLPHLGKLRWGEKQSYTRGSFIPILAIPIFLETLREMNQTIIMADDEADQPSAFLGKRFDAAVVSNDSDFIIFDIPRGFIYLPSFLTPNSTLEAFSRLENSEMDSVVPQFKVESFHNTKVCEYLKLNRLHLPLLASLIGNDLTGECAPLIFNLVLLKIEGVPTPKGLTKIHQGIYRLVRYIGTLRELSPEQALQSVREKLTLPNPTINLIYESTLSYQIDQLFLQDVLPNPHLSGQMAEKLWALYRKGVLSSQAMDVVVHSRFWGLPLIENIQGSHSSWAISTPLRLLFWILIGRPGSKEVFRNLAPTNNSTIEALCLSITDFELNQDKMAAFQVLTRLMHHLIDKAQVSARGRFWLLLAFLHCNPSGLPYLEHADYTPLLSSSIHHVAFVLLLRYLAEQLAPKVIPRAALKAFVATYAILCQTSDADLLDLYSGISASISNATLKLSNQLQALVLALSMVWGLIVNGGHEEGPSFKLFFGIDSHLFFHFCQLFSKSLPVEEILDPKCLSLFDSIISFLC